MCHLLAYLTLTRLGQMLDQACMAFLVMTAEDEDADRHSYMHVENVIHEVRFISR